MRKKKRGRRIRERWIPARAAGEAAVAISRRNPSWRSSAASPTNLFADLGASPGPGPTSPPTPIISRSCPRTSPASSTPTTPPVTSMATSLSASPQPPLARLGFLPCGAHALPLDCCSGLLLCRGGGCYYVCNPATGMWTTLPEPASGFQALALAAVQPHGASPRFHVLNFRTEPVRSIFFDVDFEEPDDGNLSDGDGDDELFDLLHWESQWYVQGLEVFSSETGKWVPTNFGLESRVRLDEAMGSVFLNGYVHLLTHEKVLAVEPEGQAWRLIPLPGSSWFGLVGCLGQSQGCLHYAVQEDGRGAMMQVGVLKDFCKGNWMLKHCSAVEVAPQTRLLFDYATNIFCNEIFYVVLFHPDTDIVFLPVEGYKLLSYNLINAEVKEICKLEPETRPRFLVYVPSYVNFVQS